MHVVVQTGKFANKMVINLVTGGCLLLWDTRLLQVERWAQSPHIFYNLSSLFVWSDVIALLVNRGAMTTQCQLHHAGEFLWSSPYRKITTGWLAQAWWLPTST